MGFSNIRKYWCWLKPQHLFSYQNISCLRKLNSLHNSIVMVSVIEGVRFCIDSSSWRWRMKTEIVGWRHRDMDLPSWWSCVFFSSPSATVVGNPVWTVVSQTSWSSTWHWGRNVILSSFVMRIRFSPPSSNPDLLGSVETHMYPWISSGRFVSFRSPVIWDVTLFVLLPVDLFPSW